MTNHWILIAGYGSIGRRHFGNLHALGYTDVRLLRSGRSPAPGFETPSGVDVYTELADALEDRPLAIVVCTPTAQHVEIVRQAVRAGVHVLLEKPVCANLEEARRLLEDVRRAPGVCSIAYCFRYHPLYREMKQVAEDGVLGRVFHARTWQASYLPGWHPWEDYRSSYAARKDLGGGVVKTLDHDLDILRWIVGQPHQVLASVGSLGGLEIDVEDTADMIFRFHDALQAHAHVSFARRDYNRGMSLTGEKASATLDWETETVTVNDGSGPLRETTIDPEFDLNTIYVDMLREAMAAFGAENPFAPIPLEEGVAALEMASGALRSSEENCVIPLSGAGMTQTNGSTTVEKPLSSTIRTTS